MKTRVLRNLRIDKIAAVDRPCQEHALVELIKRAPEPSQPFRPNPAAMKELASAMRREIEKRNKESEMTENFENASEADDLADDFLPAVQKIMKRDGCSRLEALKRAATEHPAELAAFRDGADAVPMPDAPVFVSKAMADFQGRVRDVMKRDGVGRLAAMRIAADEHPDELAALRG